MLSERNAGLRAKARALSAVRFGTTEVVPFHDEFKLTHYRGAFASGILKNIHRPRRKQHYGREGDERLHHH